MRTPDPQNAQSLAPAQLPVRRSAPQQGFTLLETLVTLFVVSLMLGAIASLFELSGRIAGVQTNLSGMQQSLRVGQYDMIRTIRMAGRGGLPRGNLPLARGLQCRRNSSYIRQAHER